MKRLICCVLLLLPLSALCYLHESLTDNLLSDRVELIACQGNDQALTTVYEQIRQQDESFSRLSEEKGRLYIKTSDRFMAQKIAAAFIQMGVSSTDFQLLDYTWGSAVIRQSAKIPWIWGALLAVMWCCRFWGNQFQAEWNVYLTHSSKQYLLEFLEWRSLTLMGKVIGLAVSVFLCIFLVRWATVTPLTLPWDFLPDESLFNLSHYQQWRNFTFPQGLVSEYGQWLLNCLKKSYLFAAAEGLLLLLYSILVPVRIKSFKRKK